MQIGPVPSMPCGESQSRLIKYSDGFLCNLCGTPYVFPGSSEPYLQFSGVFVDAYASSIYGWDGPMGTAFCYAEIEADNQEDDENYIQSAVISAQLQCGVGFDGTPGFFVEVRFSALVAPVISPTKIRHIMKSSLIELNSLCRKRQQSLCLDETDNRLRAEWTGSSFALSASWNSVAGEPWQTTSVIEQFNDNNYIGDCFDNLVNGFSATFLFLKRPSCRSVSCSCDTDLDGMRATLDGKEFTLGVTSTPYVNELGEEWGQIAGNTYEFFYRKSVEAPPGSFSVVKRVIIFCETDGTVSPPVPRWFAQFETTCFDYENGEQVSETTRTEIGYFPCFESAGCRGRPVGSPMPLGSPQEIEEVPDSPATPNGLNECTPQPRATITLFENCG